MNIQYVTEMRSLKSKYWQTARWVASYIPPSMIIEVGKIVAMDAYGADVISLRSHSDLVHNILVSS